MKTTKIIVMGLIMFFFPFSVNLLIKFFKSFISFPYRFTRSMLSAIRSYAAIEVRKLCKEQIFNEE